MAKYIVLGMALGLAVCVGFVMGYLARGDVEAYAARIVAVEGEPLRDPRCDRDVWVVGVGDRVDAIVRECYPGEHILAVKDEIRRLNPEIKSLGTIYPAQEIRLPDRRR